MEEDIKYLEEQIKINNELFEKHGYSILSQKQIQAIKSLITRTERMEEYYECCKKQNKQIIELQAENKRLKENKLQKEHWMELAKLYERENKKLKYVNEAISGFSNSQKTLSKVLRNNWVHKLQLVELKNYYINYEMPCYEEELIIKELIEKIDEILE